MHILGFWLPILVSAVVVFIASAAIWMVFKWHDKDFRKADNEDAVRSAMGGKLFASFIYYIVVGALCAYFLVMTGSSDADYLETFRITCTVAWIAYGIAYIQDSIWFGRPWSMTLKSLLDALIYGLLTGGVFGWLV